MMHWLELTILAAIQGVTEFLPISSSAHLIILPALMDWQDQGLDMDIALHAGSLCAIIIYLRHEVWQAITSFFALISGKRTNLIAYHIIITVIPVALAGFFLRDIVSLYLRNLWVIGMSSIVFGLLLWWAECWQKRTEAPCHKLNTRNAFIIGLFQMLALIPGTSRSGITMTASLFLGWERRQAARFSMLIAIPVIMLSALSTWLELFTQDEAAMAWSMMLYGFVTSALFAWLAVIILMRWLERSGFLPFVIYRLILGIILLALSIL